MNNQRPPLTPEEQELADLLQSSPVLKSPNADMDARILAAARDEFTRTGPRELAAAATRTSANVVMDPRFGRMRRWSLAAATAAAAGLAAVILLPQLRDTSSYPNSSETGQITDAQPPSVATTDGVSLPESAVITPSIEQLPKSAPKFSIRNAPTAGAPAANVAKPVVISDAIPLPPPSPVIADAATEAPAMEPPSPMAFPASPPSPPSPPAPAAHAIASRAQAQNSVAESVMEMPVHDADPNPRIDLAESAAAQKSSTSVGTVRVSGSRVVPPTLADDEKLSQAEWIKRIQWRVRTGDTVNAKDSLNRLLKRYPNAELPEDLEALRR